MKRNRLITLAGGALVGVALFGLLPGGTVRGVTPRAAAISFCFQWAAFNSSARTRRHSFCSGVRRAGPVRRLGLSPEVAMTIAYNRKFSISTDSQ